MPKRWMMLAILLAALAGCGWPPPEPPPPDAADPAPPSPQPRTSNPSDVPAYLRVPPDLPVVPGLPPPAVMPVFPETAPPQGGFAPGLPAGPVTNYGTGGMQQMPGAPPNSPYPPGGLMR